MRKLISCILMLMLLFSSGCSKKLEKLEVNDFTKDSEGYALMNLEWGITPEEAGKAIGRSLSEIVEGVTYMTDREDPIEFLGVKGYLLVDFQEDKLTDWGFHAKGGQELEEAYTEVVEKFIGEFGKETENYKNEINKDEKYKDEEYKDKNIVFDENEMRGYVWNDEATGTVLQVDLFTKNDKSLTLSVQVGKIG